MLERWLRSVDTEDTDDEAIARERRKSGAGEGDLGEDLSKAGRFSWPIRLCSAGESSSLLEASSKVEESTLRRDLALEAWRSSLIEGTSESPGLVGVGFFVAERARWLLLLLLMEGILVTVTALGKPIRATVGPAVLSWSGAGLERSITGRGGVMDLGEPTGLLLLLDLRATGFAFPRIAVWAGIVLTTALPR